jgi:hypothetical protein
MPLPPPAGNDSRMDLWARQNLDTSWTQLYSGTTTQPFGHFITQTPALASQFYLWYVHMTPGTWNMEIIWHRLFNSANARIQWGVIGAGVSAVIGTLNMHGTSLPNQRTVYQFTVDSAEPAFIEMYSHSLPSGSSGYQMGLTLITLWKD